jgi:four helix bundle protein
MKANNRIQVKSLDFAVSVTSLCLFLLDKKDESVISKQLLRAGTSVGANIEEGISVQSRKETHFRLTLACNEARESVYWLNVLKDSNLVDAGRASKLIEDCDELLLLLGKMLKTLH